MSPVGPVFPVGPVLPVGPVMPVGRVNDGIGGKVGPTRSGEIEISDFILDELNLSFLDIRDRLNLSFLDICISSFLRISDYIQ
nr:hypothetical protein [Bacillus thuringiensis]